MMLKMFHGKQIKKPYNKNVKTHVETGRLGEDQAAEFLKKRKYKIIEKNTRTKMGEIDLIVRDPKGITVFIEVKTLSDNKEGLMPEDHMTRRKIIKVRSLAEAYMAKTKNKGDYRVDLIALTISRNSFDIRHYENL